jgi:EmrB/QacA subfamily drug resistance transporter
MQQRDHHDGALAGATASASDERRRRRQVTAACMAAILVTGVQGTIVATAAPTIVAHLGDIRLVGWVFAAFFLTLAVTTPIYGRLSDVYGRKRVFLAGTSVFVVGSLACGFADGMVTLTAFRALQGIGAGAIQPIATTVIGDIYPPAERARLQGAISGMFGIASLVGPVLGAFIVEYLPWGWVFWINVPFAVLAMAMIARFFDEKPLTRRHRLDGFSAVLLMLGTGSLLILVMELVTLPLWSAGTLLAIAVLALAAFALYERRIPEPVIPASLWQNRIVVTASLGSFLIGSIFMCTVVILPTYIQGVMAYTALVAGVVLTAQSVCWSVGATISGRLMVRTSYRTCAVAGACCMMAGSVALAALDPRIGLIAIAVAACAVGIGIGFSSVTYMVSTQANVAHGTRGAATSTVLFSRLIGQALGSALGGAILNVYVARSVPGLGEALNKLLTPALRDTMAAAEMASALSVVGAAAQTVFLLVGMLAACALVVALVMPRGLGPVSSVDSP